MVDGDTLIAAALEYADYRNFENVMESAIEACKNSGQPVPDHFVKVTEMIELAKGAHREVKTVYLSLGGQAKARRRKGGHIKNFRRKAEAAADASSVNEVVSVELERDVEKYKKAEYMTYHIGEEFEGVISGVTGFGIYVQIKNTVEGLVRLNDIRDDYYDFDAEHYCIKGRRTGKTYMPGDTVTIKVMAADPEMREIDFMLVSNA